MGITLQRRITEKKKETMNQQYANQTMASQEFFELIEVPQQYEYVNEMDSQGYSPSDTMSDQDYIPVEEYSAPPAKRSRTQHQVTPPESNQSLVSENERLRAELEKLRFNMKVNQPPVKKAPKRQAPAPVKIEQSHPQIPDDLFTPGGNFVLQTPAELKEQSFFPMETSKSETELIKKEIVRQDSFSEYLNLL